MAKSNFLETIRASQQQVDQGQFEQALATLAPLLDQKDLTATQKELLDLRKLCVFNRLQWVPEAAATAEELKPLWDWENKKGLEKLAPEQALELALLHVLIGSLTVAERLYKAALTRDKSSTLYCSELAILYEQQGRKSAAIKLYDQLLNRALTKNQFDDATVRAIGRLSGLRDFAPEELRDLEAITRKYEGTSLEVRMLYSLGRARGRLGDHTREIELLIRANQLNGRAFTNTRVNGPIQESIARKDAQRQLFDQPLPDWMPQYHQSQKPYLFILGMPRSGTTLLEQILGSHSHIGNSGESRAMGIALNRVLKGKPAVSGPAVRPFTRYKLITPEDSVAIVAYYDLYQSYFTDRSIVTDKELSNIDRVGLIANMYPNARFISIRIAPLDVCASIMQQDFSMAHFANSDLECVQEYITYYQKVEHWQSLYPERFFALDYEGLVESFSDHSRAMINFIGLEWEEGINRFYERTNSVRTPSLSQVRAKINNDSVSKWKRYRSLVQSAEAHLTAIDYDYKRYE